MNRAPARRVSGSTSTTRGDSYRDLCSPWRKTSTALEQFEGQDEWQ